MQAGWVAGQSASLWQLEHVPDESQTGRASVQWSSVRHSRHRLTPVSQFGASESVQSASVMQLTQVPLAGSQTDSGAAQRVRLVIEHSPQIPLVWQAGVPSGQSASVAHSRHDLVASSQTGVGVPTQSSSVMHATQVLVAGSHIGVVVLRQAVEFCTVHSAQAPIGRHAGVMAGH